MTALSEHAKSVGHAPTINYSTHTLLKSTVEQVLTDQPEYVAPFWRVDCISLKVSIDLGFL